MISRRWMRIDNFLVVKFWSCSFLILAATTAWAETASTADSTVERGRYLARAAGCVACHTASDGEKFAGGLSMMTPIGRIYTTNITPDRTTGIGAYSLEDFARAVREGVAKDGHRLYPAMPFPSYAKISDADIQNLYAYFQHGVAAVQHDNRPSDIPFPLNFRFPLIFWDTVFLHRGSFLPDPTRDAQWNRGAYLVQAIGHCGACHTPRAVTLQEKSLSERDGADFLAGAVIEGWHAKNLRGDKDGLGQWSEADIVTFLRTGSTDHTAAFGNMAEVVEHGTQHLTDDDLTAIARYLKSLPARQQQPTVSASAQAALSSDGHATHGSATYEEFCVTCHRRDGSGVTRIFPALASNDVIETADATSLIHIVLSGGRKPSTTARPTAFAMPAFKTLDDREVAEIVTYMRSAWGNSAGPVTTEQVAELRTAFPASEATAPAPQELQTVTTVKLARPHIADIPDNTDGKQILLGRRLLAESKKLLPNNVGAALNCDSCHLNGGNVAFASPYLGMSVNYPRDNPRAGRQVTLEERVNGCLLRSMNGKALAADSPEMKAMIAYFNWLSAGLPRNAKVEGAGIGKVNTNLVPDPLHGKEIYEAKCAECHGAQGEGLKNARNEFVFPPLWGDESFNIGAGMARTYTAAAFIKNNMPIAYGLNAPLGQGGALSDQDAVDVAEYFTHQPRPDFPGKVKDWPNGGKPKDARY
jgi:thiosulfate dehydrogenase